MIRRSDSNFTLNVRITKFLLVTAFSMALLSITAACRSDDAPQPDPVIDQPLVLIPIPESEAIAARDTSLNYLSEKSWGFFGATCDRWVELDYEFDAGRTGKSEDGAIVVVFNRRPDRDLGSDTLTFSVSTDGTVQGDNKLARSGIAEGCDQW
jgi:hypothetical protein